MAMWLRKLRADPDGTALTSEEPAGAEPAGSKQPEVPQSPEFPVPPRPVEPPAAVSSEASSPVTSTSEKREDILRAPTIPAGTAEPQGTRPVTAAAQPPPKAPKPQPKADHPEVTEVGTRRLSAAPVLRPVPAAAVPAEPVPVAGQATGGVRGMPAQQARERRSPVFTSSFVLVLAGATAVLAAMYLKAPHDAATAPLVGASERPAMRHVTFEAEAYAAAKGTRAASRNHANGGRAVGPASAGDWVGYAHHSTAGIRTVGLRYTAGKGGARVQIRATSATGPLLGTILVPATPDSDTFKNVTAKLTTAASGPLYLAFRGPAAVYLDTVTLSS